MASRMALLLCLSLSLSLGSVGCARTTFKDSVADQHGAAEEDSEMDFWDGLVERSAVTNNDALSALVISFSEGAPDFAGRVAVARKRGWLALNEDLAANESARVGLIARAVCIEAGIKGGLTMRVLGPRERYAVRELNYMGWLPDMSRHQSISGAKLIALLGSVEDHLAEAPDKPKENM